MKLQYDTFEDYRIINLDDLCMNYIRDSGFELSKRGYNTTPLENLIDYFEYKYDWLYNQNADGYTLMNVNTNDMDEIDEMHELKTAYKCLCTLHYDDYISDEQFAKVAVLYKRAYEDCIKVLFQGWKRGEPQKTHKPVPYNVLCDEQKIINEGNKTRPVSIFD